MDVQELLNSLNAGGFAVAPHGDSGISVSPGERLTPEQRLAIREHKATLRLLACIPSPEADAYGEAEREAIQFADAGGLEADMALIRARFELLEEMEPPSPCPRCGSLVFRWDLHGNRHCIMCEPGQSARILRIVDSIRESGRMRIARGLAITRATLTHPLNWKG